LKLKELKCAAPDPTTETENTFITGMQTYVIKLRGAEKRLGR